MEFDQFGFGYLYNHHRHTSASPFVEESQRHAFERPNLLEVAVFRAMRDSHVIEVVVSTRSSLIYCNGGAMSGVQ